MPKGELKEEITEEALRQYQLDVELFVDLAKNIKAVPILMIPARLVSPNNTEAEKRRIKYQYALLNHRGLLKAFEATDKILQEVAQNKSAYLINANQELGGRGDLFIDHIHLNPRGSEALAQFTARQLEKILAERTKSSKSEP